LDGFKAAGDTTASMKIERNDKVVVVEGVLFDNVATPGEEPADLESLSKLGGWTWVKRSLDNTRILLKCL